MKRFLKLFYLEMMINIRTLIYYILIMPLIFYTFFSIKDGLGDITASAYVVQILIVGTMIVGYQICTREEKDECKGILLISKCRMEMVNARALAAIVFNVIFSLIVLLVIVIFYCVGVKEKWLINEVIMYWFIYFFLVAIISTLIGQIIGNIINSKLSYLLIIFISVAIGALGKEFLELFGTTLHISLFKKISGYISVGQYDAFEKINYLYGLEIESKRLFHRLLYIALLVIILKIVMCIKQKCNVSECIKQIAVSGIVCIIAFMLFSNPTFCRKTGHMEEEGKYLTKSVDMCVDVRKKLNVSVKEQIEILEDTNLIEMTLYHNLKVSSIVGEKENIDYEQNGDFITVKFNKVAKKGEVKTINIEYSGLSSQYFFAGEKATYLPGNFAWIPVPGKKMVFKEGPGFVVLNQIENNEVDYTVKYKSYHKVFSNLNYENGVLKGKSKCGVTLISGNMEEDKINGVHIYFTLNNKIRYKNLASKILDIYDKCEEILQLKCDTINNIYVVPTDNNVFGRYGAKTMILDDTIITGAFEVAEGEDDYLLNEILVAILSKQNFGDLDSEAQNDILEQFTIAVKEQDREKIESVISKYDIEVK
ncbi:MAG: hypothetical protein K6G88_09480 [Lachnospiraceae bacterium]|nr:hypothetical protein [Lachnospiraceae bacterium]